MERVRKEKSKDMKMKVNRIKKLEEKRGITLIALVITIALNCLRSGRKLECVA